MKFLVTGGAGFIGHNVVRILESQQHQCVIVDNLTDYGILNARELTYLSEHRLSQVAARHYNVDIRDCVAIEHLMADFKPDVVIHLASFPRQKAAEKNPRTASEVMIAGLTNLLESARHHNVKKFVYISSSMVYGDFASGTHELAPCQPQGSYGILKLAGEWLVQDYHRLGFFDHTIVRPSAVYGEWDVEDRVISKFITRALRGEPITVHGASEVLDFTHVSDTAQGIALAATSDRSSGKIYNITRSADQESTLLDAAKLIVDIAGQGEIVVADRDARFPRRGHLDITQARTDLGYDPKVDITEGFTRYYEWYKENPLLWS
jgi:nucleoside-diphosphate-sugar epimerase